MEQQNIWVWNKKPTPIEDLDEKQLYSIKKSITNSNNKTWFGTNSDIWLKVINETLIEKNKFYSHLKRLRINRAIKDTDLIINGMIKCMNKTTIKQNLTIWNRLKN